MVGGWDMCASPATPATTRRTVFFEPPHGVGHQPLTGWTSSPTAVLEPYSGAVHAEPRFCGETETRRTRGRCVVRALCGACRGLVRALATYPRFFTAYFWYEYQHAAPRRAATP